MKTYTAPRVADLGDVFAQTGVFGAQATRDVFIDDNGVVQDTGTQSKDICVTSDLNRCDASNGG